MKKKSNFMAVPSERFQRVPFFKSFIFCRAWKDKPWEQCRCENGCGQTACEFIETLSKGNGVLSSSLLAAGVFHGLESLSHWAPDRRRTGREKSPFALGFWSFG